MPIALCKVKRTPTFWRKKKDTTECVFVVRGPCRLFFWSQVWWRRYHLNSEKLKLIISSLVLLLGPSTGQDTGIESTSCQGPGVKYVGTVSTSSSGQRCQNWNSTEPQRHTDMDVGSHNFCRNPHNVTAGVWCYTTNYYVRWEYCEVWKILMSMDDNDDVF